MVIGMGMGILIHLSIAYHAFTIKKVSNRLSIIGWRYFSSFQNCKITSLEKTENHWKLKSTIPFFRTILSTISTGGDVSGSLEWLVNRNVVRRSNAPSLLNCETTDVWSVLERGIDHLVVSVDDVSGLYHAKNSTDSYKTTITTTVATTTIIIDLEVAMECL